MADKASAAGPDTSKVRYIVMAAVLGMLAITLGPKLLDNLEERKILENGTLAPAKIIDLDETGNQVNRQPEIEITFEIQPPEGEPFTAKGTQVMSALELKRYDVGSRVKVRYDPDNRRKAVLVGLDKSAPETPDAK